ncbi:MAG: WGxxGxxG-CTERM domain-containing protein [Waterburya sp.]
MNLNNLTASTILALAIALPTGQVLSQEAETIVNPNASQTEQNIDQVGEDLQGTDNTTTTETTVIDDLQGIDNTTTETTGVDDLQDTGNTVETTVDNTIDDTETTNVDDLQETDNAVESTIDNTIDDTEATNLDDLQETDNAVESTIDNTGEEVEPIITETEEIVDEAVETDAVVEEKFNWDWLGLIGLLGLFGLTGKNKKTEVAHRDLGVGSATGTNHINHDVNNTDVNNINENVHK